MKNLLQLSSFIFLLTISLTFQLQKETTNEYCRFAKEYSAEKLLQDPEMVSSFLRSFVSFEAKFMKLAVDPKTGFTYDGIRVDVDSGQPIPQTLHKFTASSKECIHLAMMAKVLNGDQYGDEIYNPTEIFRLIELKVASLDAFYSKYPGFAGYLPWVLIEEDGLTPSRDFLTRVPALDNGQMFWAAFLFSRVWNKRFPNVLPQLRQRFDELFWKGMIRNSRKVFFNQTTFKIRAVADIKDPSLPVSQNTYTNKDNYYLDDPYEGELFTWIITLFCKDQFTEQEIEFLWTDKRNKLQSAQLQVDSQNATITVEKGWWFSSHQQWKLLFLPYRLSPTYKRVMFNNQRARAWNSLEKNLPGMYGCEAGPAAKNEEDTGYFCSGIPEISFQKTDFKSLVTPYGVFPLLLVNQTLGTIWLHNSIRSPAGQTQYGALEGTGINGTQISPVLTWDTKITAALAAMGGLQSLANDFLEQQGLLQQFATRIEKQYKMVFAQIKGQELAIPLPKRLVLEGRPDFTGCE